MLVQWGLPAKSWDIVMKCFNHFEHSKGNAAAVVDWLSTGKSSWLLLWSSSRTRRTRHGLILLHQPKPPNSWIASEDSFHHHHSKLVLVWKAVIFFTLRSFKKTNHRATTSFFKKEAELTILVTCGSHGKTKAILGHFQASRWHCWSGRVPVLRTLMSLFSHDRLPPTNLILTPCMARQTHTRSTFLLFVMHANCPWDSGVSAVSNWHPFLLLLKLLKFRWQREQVISLSFFKIKSHGNCCFPVKELVTRGSPDQHGCIKLQLTTTHCQKIEERCWFSFAKHGVKSISWIHKRKDWLQSTVRGAGGQKQNQQQHNTASKAHVSCACGSWHSGSFSVTKIKVSLKSQVMMECKKGQDKDSSSLKVSSNEAKGFWTPMQAAKHIVVLVPVGTVHSKQGLLYTYSVVLTVQSFSLWVSRASRALPACLLYKQCCSKAHTSTDCSSHVSSKSSRLSSFNCHHLPPAHYGSNQL